MKKKLPNAYRLPRDVQKLDLHGYTKSECLLRATQFLDRMISRQQRRKSNSNEAWVLIVTGSGSHSAHGPILRSAVENLLIKRRIEYYQMKGRGSFLANALSGFVLYEPEQPRDSKVVVVPSVPPCDFYDHELGIASSRNNSVPTIKALSLTQQIVPTETATTSIGNKSLKKAFIQQQNEQSAYQKAISESLTATQQAKKEDEELIERACNLSILDKNREMEEEQKLERAIVDSQHEALFESQKEEDQLRKVPELSEAEFQQQQRNSMNDECVIRAIELSQQHQQESNTIDNAMLIAVEQSILDHQQYKKSDEELLLKALEQSVVEF